MKSAIVLLGIGISALFGAAIGFLPDDGLDHGKEVYAMQKCALCHSISGVGGKKLALDGVGSRLKTEELKKWIRAPRVMKPATTMKAYPNLPEKDLNDLTAFLMILK